MPSIYRHSVVLTHKEGKFYFTFGHIIIIIIIVVVVVVVVIIIIIVIIIEP
jgi:hypothetical protein